MNYICPRRDGHNFFNPIYTICVYVYIYMYISIHPKSISIHLSKIRVHIISVITLCLQSLAIIVHLQLMVIAMLFEPFLSQLGKSCLPSVCWGLMLQCMLQCEQPNSQKLPTESSTGSTSQISQAWVAWVVYEYVHLTIYYAQYIAYWYTNNHKKTNPCTYSSDQHPSKSREQAEIPMAKSPTICM